MDTQEMGRHGTTDHIPELAFEVGSNDCDIAVVRMGAFGATQSQQPFE